MTEPLRYPVTKEWIERVRQVLEQKGRGASAKMADELGITRAVLSELLAGEYDTSPHVEAIHRYFGWSPPLPPTAALDAGTGINGYMRLSAADRRLADTAVEVLLGVKGEQAKRALVELLGLCRSY